MRAISALLVLLFASSASASGWFLIDPPNLDEDGDIIIEKDPYTSFHWYLIVPFSTYQTLRVYVRDDHPSLPAEN